MEKLKETATTFSIDGTVDTVKPLGDGLINDTYLVKTAEPDAPDYVLQRINNAIFTDVEGLQANIEAVTAHIKKKLQADGTDDIDRKVLEFVPVKATGKTYLHDGDSYWRMSRFIPGSHTLSAVTPETAYITGLAFGNFQSMLTDIDRQLVESIPRFHDMEFRLQQLREAVESDAVGRCKEVTAELDEIFSRADLMCTAEKLHRQGLLPKRICHCDTKVNNMLFDDNNNVLCVIDLDTVMPSYVFSDYGDFLRTAANTGDEDDRDLNRVSFNMEIFKAFTKGYLESAGKFLSPVETEHLPYAAALFPYMQAVRFLADYINGDTYYKTAYPEHNLVRTSAQLKLLYSVEANTPAMRDYIASL